MATHSSVLAWRIPGTGEPGGLPSMGSRRVRHDWSDLAAAAVPVRHCGWGTPGPAFCSSPSLWSFRGWWRMHAEFHGLWHNVPETPVRKSVAWAGGLKGNSPSSETQTIWSLISHIRGQKTEPMRELREEETREHWAARLPCALLDLPCGEKTIHDWELWPHCNLILCKHDLVTSWNFQARALCDPCMGNRKGDPWHQDRSPTSKSVFKCVSRFKVPFGDRNVGSFCHHLYGQPPFCIQIWIKSVIIYDRKLLW